LLKSPNMVDMEKVTCWSCGKPLPCACGNEAVPYKVTPPKEILPVCGSSEIYSSPKTNYQNW